MMDIVVRKVDGNDHDQLQIASHLLLHYAHFLVDMRDTNTHNQLHYPGQVLFYDIARISYIIDTLILDSSGNPRSSTCPIS